MNNKETNLLVCSFSKFSSFLSAPLREREIFVLSHLCGQSFNARHHARQTVAAAHAEVLV